MSDNLCEMSLQQTLSLLQLTDQALHDICCKRFTRDFLYQEIFGKVLGGKGRRGPASFFLIFQEESGVLQPGRAFHMKDGALVERSDEISLDPFSGYAVNLLEAQAQEEVVLVNWADSYESIGDFQAYFHPAVKNFIGAPIINFIICRISGAATGAIVAFNYPGRATTYDAEVLKSMAVVIGSLQTMSDEVQETEKAFRYTIEALARACEAAEEDTGKHIQRVNRYAGALAANMGLPNDFVETISFSAQMHDVGKIKIPATILLKPGPLDDAEAELMRKHPIYGQQILGDSPRLQLARDIAIAHHENWDGSGYPYQLKGDNIPLAGRIVKVADVYDALRSNRSYKNSLSHQAALSVFRHGDERINPAKHFDPVLLGVFFKIEHIFDKIYESFNV
ncbi:HD domain-containing phosphohydrolase [Geotalea sp. SG265]|uniref:HD-GYP domain-containing protein n=1 Tax=Geotalea sp. SG265 TaxID=2922867 RepID=UPI001FAEFC18|nr:HD domain-containing phosphohydrolase [Geotalea sp. SG265]